MKMPPVFFSLLTVIIFLIGHSHCRIHKLRIEKEIRRYIPLTSFGFYRGGILDAKFKRFHYESPADIVLFGFTLERIQTNAANPEIEMFHDRCLLAELQNRQNKSIEKNIMYFVLDLKNKLLVVNCTSTMYDLSIYKDTSTFPSFPVSEQNSFENDIPRSKGRSCLNLSLPIEVETTSNGKVFSTQFVIYIPTEREEGLYELFFHNCYSNAVSFTMEIEEHNLGNYLSAGQIPLPALYFMMSVIFFLSGLFWIHILIKSRYPVYKIHYLMASLVILKSLTLLFHAINYHFIEIKGEHVATWAILYYVTHLLKGSVLFITIILIGTGWNFIKHILSKKDKKIFMIVIPLQVFANIAGIIIEESEEGDPEYRTWLELFIFVDLVCCGAILFPIVWSIKHLQDASQTDGKAAINLRKLKIFRHFYIMFVCYIYFTRIIVYLLKVSVPFQYEWIDEMFKEIVTFVFFVLTGYKFRPASANPYFQAMDQDDSEMDCVVSQCGLTEGLTKLSRISNEMAEDDKDTLLIYKRENSHDYD